MSTVSWWIHRKLLTVSSIDLSKLFSIMCMQVFVYVWLNPLCYPVYVNTCVMCEPTCARSHLSSKPYCAERRLAALHFRGSSPGWADLCQPLAWLKTNCHYVSSKAGAERLRDRRNLIIAPGKYGGVGFLTVTCGQKMLLFVLLCLLLWTSKHVELSN